MLGLLTAISGSHDHAFGITCVPSKPEAAPGLGVWEPGRDRRDPRPTRLGRAGPPLF